MTTFQFASVAPRPQLTPYLARIQVFESTGRLPIGERKLIVPNANLKLTLTYRNGIVANVGQKTFTQAENRLSLTGLIDLPVSLDPYADAPTGTIIIEFNPAGAHRFFRLSYDAVRNQIVELSNLVGNATRQLEGQLAEASSMTVRLQLLQAFLIKRLETTAADPIYDYCVNRISDTNGLLTVAQLERETGYTTRWLRRKFMDRLGTGPKNLSEILRFKQLYQAYSTGARWQDLKDQIYQKYHDQSHFLKAFKRFTGSTPTALQGGANELSTRHFAS